MSQFNWTGAITEVAWAIAIVFIVAAMAWCSVEKRQSRDVGYQACVETHEPKECQ